jgi:amino acid transporter
MNILDLVVGKPIRTSDERAEQIGPVQGIPIFGLDGLSSAAYGPEAALTLLLPLGILGVRYIVPISAAIITLLVIVYFSYRQTIAAYPSGGGSYTVARFNLGASASLLAAAALLADYILTAAVGISAGVGALISAVPTLLPHTVSLCVGILIIITIVNLRGVREAGAVFAIPTYLFVGTLLITVVAGIIRVLLSGGHPTPAVPLPPPPPITQAVTFWLLLKVFASGCTALTGVEAVSNGVKAFREPTVKNAQRSLTAIIFLLAVLLAGISYLVKTYEIAATDPGQPGYQSILSMLTAAVFGKGLFYYLTIGSILVVLSLSANTAFADFPRLCRAIAQNNYLPHVFGYRGRRLVYTYGIVVLAVLCGGVLILFGGVTDRLIPLYAIGAFMAFTLSQAGMVMHWRKNRGPQWVKSALVNGLGALVTGITTGVVLVAKFAEGAWITLLFIPLMIVIFAIVRRHYHSVKVLTSCKIPVDAAALSQHPIVVVAIDRWSNITRQGIEFAARLSPEVIALHVDPSEHSELLEDDWEHYVAQPFPCGRQGATPTPPAAVALPLCHRPHRSVHSRPFEKKSRSQHCCGHTGAGGGPMV